MTDGLEFATADIFDNNKLNQKCTTIGNGTQLNALVNSHAGQQIFPTDTSNGWLVDRPDSRDSADTKWHYPQLRVGSVTTIGENPGVESILSGATINNSAMYIPFTLPTTEKFYQVISCEGIGGNTNPSLTLKIRGGIDMWAGNSINAGISTLTTSAGFVGFGFTFSNRMYIPGGSNCAIWIAETNGQNFTLGRRTSGTSPTSWSVYTGGGIPTTPYTSQSGGGGSGSTYNNMLFTVTYQGYY